jgi:hypothetical protein
MSILIVRADRRLHWNGSEILHCVVDPTAKISGNSISGIDADRAVPGQEHCGSESIDLSEVTDRAVIREGSRRNCFSHFEVHPWKLGVRKSHTNHNAKRDVMK